MKDSEVLLMKTLRMYRDWIIMITVDAEEIHGSVWP